MQYIPQYSQSVLPTYPQAQPGTRQLSPVRSLPQNQFSTVAAPPAPQARPAGAPLQSIPYQQVASSVVGNRQGPPGSFASNYLNTSQTPIPQQSVHQTSQQGVGASSGGGHGSGGHGEHGDEYEALKIPGNLEEAKQHAEARKTGNISDIPNHEKKFCKCCGFQVQRQEMDFVQHSSYDLRFLGSGFPLFFNFIKYCIIILSVFILTSGLYNLITNYQGHFCDHTDILDESEQQIRAENIDIEKEMKTCHKSFAHVFSIVNKKNSVGHDGTVYNTADEYLPTQHILNLLVAGFVMIILMLFRRSQRILDAEIDEVQCTPSDFTVIVKNIPKGLDCDYEKELKHIFTHNVVRNEQGESVPMNVTKVNLVYDIDHVLELEENLKSVVKKKQAFLEKNGFRDQKHGYVHDDPVLQDWEEEIEHIEGRIHKVEHNVPEDQPNYFTGTAFISFQNEKQKDMVVEQNTYTFSEQVSSYFNKGELKNITNDDLTWEKNKLFVDEAPEPDDIDWEFIHISTKRKIWARIGAWAKTIAFLVACYLVMKALTIYQSKRIEDTYAELGRGELNKFNWYTTKLLTFSISMGIVLFNKFVLGKVFHIIVDEEYYSTKSKFNIAFALKLAIGLFVNSALLAYFVEILGEKNFYGPGGFIQTETWVFVWNALLPPTVWLIDPWTWLKDRARKKMIAKAKKGKNYLTQDETNKMMEQVEYTQGKRYADIMKTMWFTFFYAPAIPLGLIFSLLNMFYYYLIDQYNIMKRRTIKETLSCEVSIEQIENLELTIIFYAIGNITFSIMLFDNVDTLGWVLLGVAILYATLPMQEINEKLFPIDKEPEELQYQDAEKVFITDYDRLNPITKNDALRRMKKIMQGHSRAPSYAQRPVDQRMPMKHVQDQLPQYMQKQVLRPQHY